jgi:hypothetical protein
MHIFLVFRKGDNSFKVFSCIVEVGFYWWRKLEYLKKLIFLITNACLPIFVTFEELPWLLLIKKIFEKKIYTKNTEILS